MIRPSLSLVRGGTGAGRSSLSAKTMMERDTVLETAGNGIWVPAEITAVAEDH